MEETEKIKKAIKLYNEFICELGSLGIDTHYAGKGLEENKDRLKRLTCNHAHTRVEYSHDSHSDWVETICEDCGEIIKMEKE